MKKKLNTKMILASAFLAALVFPFIAGAATTTSTSDTSATITVDKAIDAVWANSATVALGTTTPTSTTADRNVTSASQTLLSGWRSNATADLQQIEQSAASGFSSKLQTAAAAPGASNTCTGTYQNLTSTPLVQTAVDDMARNSSNNLQGAITTCFRQPVSWADQGGTGQQTIGVRFVLTNGA